LAEKSRESTARRADALAHVAHRIAPYNLRKATGAGASPGSLIDHLSLQIERPLQIRRVVSL
jgi:hypothetical protein